MNIRHKKIINISTFFHKGKQRVEIEIKNNKASIYLTPSNIKQNTNVEVNELEILIGSKIRPTYFKIGEKMLNGEKCTIENLIIKDFWITPSTSIEEMRKLNESKILPLKRIQKVFQFTRNNKNSVGFDIGEEKAIFLSSNRLEGLTQLDPSEFHILQNSYVAPVYFQKGEVLFNGEKAYKSNVLLKKLNLRYSGTVEEMHSNIVEDNSNFYYSENDNSKSYDQYGGPSDGYGDYLDDDFINDALGGEPSAYWNID